jgi:hypothetical protein
MPASSRFGHLVHKSRAVKALVQAHSQRLRPAVLPPGYCPAPNPDELLNQDVKTDALGKKRPVNKSEMIEARAKSPASPPKAAHGSSAIHSRKDVSDTLLGPLVHYAPFARARPVVVSRLKAERSA